MFICPKIEATVIKQFSFYLLLSTTATTHCCLSLQGWFLCGPHGNRIIQNLFIGAHLDPLKMVSSNFIPGVACIRNSWLFQGWKTVFIYTHSLFCLFINWYLRDSIAAMKHHDHKEVREGRACLAYPSISYPLLKEVRTGTWRQGLM